MSILKRLAVAVLIMAVVMGVLYVAGEPGPAPAAGGTAQEDPAETLEQGSPLVSARSPGPGTSQADRLPEPRASSRPDQRPDGPAGPSVFPRPPATLDGVALTPGRWVMPMAPRTYRMGCAWACYVSDSGLPHTGQDFPTDVGTPVRSVGAGVVVRSESIYLDQGEKTYCTALPICGRDWTSYGNFIQIRDAADPTLTIWYAHLATRRVAAGQRVGIGQVIATGGDVGNSEGPHLHFEIRRDDRAEDPMPLLHRRGAVPQPGPAPVPTPVPVPAPSAP